MRGGAVKRALAEANEVDQAVYAAIAGTTTPTLDRAMSGLSRAADHSKVSVAVAAFLALARGREGRRAAVLGMASVALTSAVVNLGLKPLLRRRRPDRESASVPAERQVSMPVSRSFPSGHSAAAFAFAAGAGRALPSTAPALTALATLVAYSRVHTGVHYPGDVIAGSVCGLALSTVATVAVDRSRG